MLEILGIIYFVRQIGPIAEQKGKNPATWKFFAILGWLVTELLVVFGLVYAGVDSMAFILLGPLSGLLGYFLVRQILSSKPDADDELLADFGKDVES